MQPPRANVHQMAIVKIISFDDIKLPASGRRTGNERRMLALGDPVS